MKWIGKHGSWYKYLQISCISNDILHLSWHYVVDPNISQVSPLSQHHTAPAQFQLLHFAVLWPLSGCPTDIGLQSSSCPSKGSHSTLPRVGRIINEETGPFKLGTTRNNTKLCLCVQLFRINWMIFDVLSLCPVLQYFSILIGFKFSSNRLQSSSVSLPRSQHTKWASAGPASVGMVRNEQHNKKDCNFESKMYIFHKKFSWKGFYW